MTKYHSFHSIICMQYSVVSRIFVSTIVQTSTSLTQCKNRLEVRGQGHVVHGYLGRKVAKNLKSHPNQRQRSNQKPGLQTEDIGLVDAYDGVNLETSTGRHAEEIQGGPK